MCHVFTLDYRSEELDVYARLGGVIHRMSRLQQAEHSLARRVRASLTEVAGSTNGGGRPGRRSA